MNSVGQQQLTGSHVVLTCGVARSGKSTFARQLESQGYERLSIDDALWDLFEQGRMDDPAEAPRIARDVEVAIRERLIELVLAGKNAVVDFSFADRSSRDAYRALASRNGAIVDLVYFRLPIDETRSQLLSGEGTAEGVEKGSTDAYLDHFDVPTDDENPIVIDVQWPDDAK